MQVFLMNGPHDQDRPSLFVQHGFSYFMELFHGEP